MEIDPHKIEYDLGTILKSKSNDNQIHILCNECGKKAMYLNVHNSLYHCFSCGRSGRLELKTNLPRTVKTFNVALQNRILSYLIKVTELEEDHQKELLERRIFRPNRYLLRTIPLNVSQLLSTKFSYKDLVDSGLISLDGKLISQLTYGNLLIPFISKGVIVGYQVRVNKRDSSDNFKYLMFPGSKVGHHFYYTKAVPPQNHIIVTESPLKAISADDAGYNCAGFVGINPADQAIFDLRTFLSRSKAKGYLIYDSSINESSLDNLQKAKERFLVLIKKPFTDVSLPLMSYKKMDLDKYLFLKGTLNEFLQ